MITLATWWPSSWASLSGRSCRGGWRGASAGRPWIGSGGCRACRAAPWRCRGTPETSLVTRDTWHVWPLPTCTRSPWPSSMRTVWLAMLFLWLSLWFCDKIALYLPRRFKYLYLRIPGQIQLPPRLHFSWWRPELSSCHVCKRATKIDNILTKAILFNCTCRCHISTFCRCYRYVDVIYPWQGQWKCQTCCPWPRPCWGGTRRRWGTPRRPPCTPPPAPAVKIFRT